MKVRRFVSALLLACALGGCETAPRPAAPADLYGPPEKPAPVAAPSISAERMSEITRVLASDEFQGRSMGTPGEEKTVAYLIEQFQAAGLEPGGENGGWTQTVPMIRTKLAAAEPVDRAGGQDDRAALSRRTSISAPSARWTRRGSRARRWSSSAMA